MSEFGRTPQDQHRYGRDHWGDGLVGAAWAAAAFTPAPSSARRTTTAPRSSIARSITATCSTRYLPAVGVDPDGEFDIDGRKIPIADPAKGPIKELLA